jgi:superoxide dismutase, Fe-Mn family
MNPLPDKNSAIVPAVMMQLPRLHYGLDALEPFLSAKTMGFHYGKHHQTYIDNLNKLVVGTPFAVLSLEDMIFKTVNTADTSAIFNNAAQVWNHAFYWYSMKPKGGGQPTGKLLEMICAVFGTFEAFKNAFVTAGVGQFGSGWVWLIQEGETVKIIKTSNADTPVAYGQQALLTCDVWEHAYYLDYQNRRKEYVTAFLDGLVNWEFAASRLK